jgi:hypothetical protein
VHLGRKAATIWASQDLSFPLKLASVISVIIVTTCVSPYVARFLLRFSPKTSFNMALLSAQPEKLDDRQSKALGDLRVIFQCFSKVLCTFSANSITTAVINLIGDIQARQRTPAGVCIIAVIAVIMMMPLSRIRIAIIRDASIYIAMSLSLSALPWIGERHVH